MADIHIQAFSSKGNPTKPTRAIATDDLNEISCGLHLRIGVLHAAGAHATAAMVEKLRDSMRLRDGVLVVEEEQANG